MINPDCARMINDHLPLGFKAQHVYLAYSLVANAMGCPGVEQFFKEASMKAHCNAHKMLCFLNNYDMKPTVPGVEAIPFPNVTPNNSSAMRDMLIQALAMEQASSAGLNAIMDYADDECKDFQTFGFIQCMQNEQTDCEIELRNIINRFDMSGGDMPGLDEYVGELVE